jgi:hypothetical protein
MSSSLQWNWAPVLGTGMSRFRDVEREFARPMCGSSRYCDITEAKPARRFEEGAIPAREFVVIGVSSRIRDRSQANGAQTRKTSRSSYKVNITVHLPVPIRLNSSCIRARDRRFLRYRFGHVGKRPGAGYRRIREARQMSELPEMLPVHTCQQCAHRWAQQTVNHPSCCPNCRTTAFDRPLRRAPRNPEARERWERARREAEGAEQQVA